MESSLCKGQGSDRASSKKIYSYDPGIPRSMCECFLIEFIQEQSVKIAKSFDGSIYGQSCPEALEAVQFTSGSASSGEL